MTDHSFTRPMNIVQIAAGFGLVLTACPNGQHKCLCPFHDERTPSFYVNPKNNTFHCLACGAYGDVVGFVMRMTQCSFPMVPADPPDVSRPKAGAGFPFKAPPVDLGAWGGAVAAPIHTEDGEPGLYRAGDVFRKVEAEDAAFWRCAATGIDCRTVERPALAVIFMHDTNPPGCRLAMYSTAELADEVAEHMIEAPAEVGPIYLFDALLHLSGKTWVNPHALLEAVRKIAWDRGDRSWAFGYSAGPFAKGRAS